MATVLLIEDEDAVRMLLRTALEQAGHRVHEAADGAKGIRRLGEAPVDLVITDIFMPGRDGLEVLQTLRCVHPGIKVLAITGGSDTVAFLEVARYLGAASVLRKPFELAVFVQTVADLLSGGASSQAIEGSKS